MPPWRAAKSLEVLLAQVNAAYPGRNKDSDGIIGDTRHQQEHSDHNPDAEGVVRAIDITHDPKHGVDTYAMANAMSQARDSRVSYLISNRRICNSKVAPWTWRPYSGSDDHTGHIHISVVSEDTLSDDTRKWVIGTEEVVATPKQSGRGSWFSQHSGKYQWVDNSDRPNSNALGVPDSAQGIALYDHSTLGKFFSVTAPNGVTLTLQQTDIGPNPSTGRTIDIAAVAAERFGYSPVDFPTDGIFSWTQEDSKMPTQPPPGPAPTVVVTHPTTGQKFVMPVIDLAQIESMLQNAANVLPFLSAVPGIGPFAQEAMVVIPIVEGGLQMADKIKAGGHIPSIISQELRTIADQIDAKFPKP